MTSLNRLWFGSDWGDRGRHILCGLRVSIAFGSALIGVLALGYNNAWAYVSIAFGSALIGVRRPVATPTTFAGLNRLWFGSDWGAMDKIPIPRECGLNRLWFGSDWGGTPWTTPPR